MIKLPPTELPANPLIALMQSGPEQLEQYLPFFAPLDGKGRYLPFDEFRHRISRKLDLNIAWALTKLARHNALQPLLPLLQLLPTLRRAQTTQLKPSAAWLRSAAASDLSRVDRPGPDFASLPRTHRLSGGVRGAVSFRGCVKFPSMA